MESGGLHLRLECGERGAAACLADTLASNAVPSPARKSDGIDSGGLAAVRLRGKTAPQPIEQMGAATILVIDDEEVVRSVTQAILQRFGYNVLIASCGAEAVQVARTHPGEIHLAILDIGLPVISGLETFPLLKKERPGMKVIVSSGSALDVDSGAQALLDAGADSFLPKPFRMADLQQALRKTLDS